MTRYGKSQRYSDATCCRGVPPVNLSLGNRRCRRISFVYQWLAEELMRPAGDTQGKSKAYNKKTPAPPRRITGRNRGPLQEGAGDWWVVELALAEPRLSWAAHCCRGAILRKLLVVPEFFPAHRQVPFFDEHSVRHVRRQGGGVDNRKPTRAMLLPPARAANHPLCSIEGLAPAFPRSHASMRWIEFPFAEPLRKSVHALA